MWSAHVSGFLRGNACEATAEDIEAWLAAPEVGVDGLGSYKPAPKYINLRTMRYFELRSS